MLLLLISALFGQKKEITRDEFYTMYRTASSLAENLRRREIQKITRFRNGMPYSTEEWVYEYQPPNNIRYRHNETSGGIMRVTEEVNIGDRKFCRKDGGKWEIVKGSCIGGGGISGLPNVLASLFTQERVTIDGDSALLFREYTTYKNTYSETAKTDGLSYWEKKFWTNKSNLIVRNETRRGLITGPALLSLTEETIKYDPKITIEAPIK